MSRFGIDVSHYQLDIDWKQVPSSGIKFVIMKAMYETSHKPDEYFERNYAGCVANGIDKGAYIFIGSRSVMDPVDDAEAFLDVLDGRKLEYGIWLDLESKNIRTYGKAVLTNIIVTEAEIFESAGYRVGLYTNLDWYRNVIDKDILVNKYPFWIARYPKYDGGELVNSLSPEAFAEAWQYSSKGKVAGIRGNVDMDIDFSYAEFMKNYSIAEEVLAGKWGSEKTTPTRRERLQKAGYSYRKIQPMVNAIYRMRTRKK